MIPVVTFFNNKGGVGKTSLVYHLACMYASQGVRTLVADLDPQANLTSLFFDDTQVELLWDPRDAHTIFEPIAPIFERTGGLGEAHAQQVREHLHALIGTPRLARLEGELAENWSKCVDGNRGAFVVMTAFANVLQRSAATVDAAVVLVDVGPSLGAINRAALVASDFVVMPLGADLFSLAGIENLGAWLNETRERWAERRARSSDDTLPPGLMAAGGYVVSQHIERAGRPAKASRKWMERIPPTYARSVLDSTTLSNDPRSDPNCLGIVKHYRSLMPMAQEARKPIFQLTAADGAIGSHALAAQQAARDFGELADRIAAATWRPAAVSTAGHG